MVITSSMEPLLFSIHQKIEEQYRKLPWPKQVRNIQFLTQMEAGYGDASSACKVIKLMHKMCPELQFDWTVTTKKLLAEKFLGDLRDVKVHVRTNTEKGESSPADLLILGPVLSRKDAKETILQEMYRKLQGPIFAFEECGLISPLFDEQAVITYGKDKEYSQVYSMLFPAGRAEPPEGSEGWATNSLSTGISPGRGILLDEELVNTSLSKQRFLEDFTDESLSKDISAAMGGEFDDNNYSFNVGYAHDKESHTKFIECVALHESKKHVVIVLNQQGKDEKDIVNDQLLSALKEYGYGTIVVKGEKKDSHTLCKEEGKKYLTIIVRSAFSPVDMRRMQLAAERLLATGDNSAAEAFSARCSLYLYEKPYIKEVFFRQQIALATGISKNLGKLLHAFGEEKTVTSEMKEILKDPDVGKHTLALCDKVIKEHSLAEKLEAALKRTVWWYVLPDLKRIEADAMPQSFRQMVMDYVATGEENEEMTVSDADIALLGEKVQHAVEDYLATQET